LKIKNQKLKIILLWIVTFAKEILKKLILKTQSFSQGLSLIWVKSEQEKEPEFALNINVSSRKQ